MNIEKIRWEEGSEPECNNGDIVVLVQYGEAEIARYVTPKPKGAPPEGGDFVLEVCDNEDGLEEEVFKLIAKQYPEEVSEEVGRPFLFACPVEFSCRAIWR